MQTSVKIAPEIMDWVLGHIEVEKMKESMVKDIELWMAGNKIPTFNQIEKLSRATNIPLGYFFLKTPPTEELSLLEFRTVESYELEKPSRNLIDTIHDMENVQDWMKNYSLSLDKPALEFIGSHKNSQNPKNIVEDIRGKLELEVDWYKNSKDADSSFKKIRSSAEAIGIIVMMSGIVGNNTHRKLEVNEFRAFTLIDDYAPLIFINSNDSFNGKLFSMIHEIAHVWLGTNDFYNDRSCMGTGVSETETICNEIAGEILVPQRIFVQKWESQSKISDLEQKISSVAYYFKCGTTVIARRALLKGFINLPQYNLIATKAVEYYNLRQENKKNGPSGGDYYNTMATRIDHRFLMAIANSAQEGKTLYTDAFRLTNTNRSTFINLTRKIRGEMW